MNGLHILAELYDCLAPSPLLCDASAVAAHCRYACDRAGLSVVAEAFHQFPGAGATGALVLAESHLAVHTWPEIKAVTLDLYVCNFSQNNQAAAEEAFDWLVSDFAPQRLVRRDVRRGTNEKT